jgi:hypothetical protein
MPTKTEIRFYLFWQILYFEKYQSDIIPFPSLFHVDIVVLIILVIFTNKKEKSINVIRVTGLPIFTYLNLF